MKALVIAESGYTPGALAAIRELGQAGWTVGVGLPVRAGYVLSSRWCCDWHPIPCPAEDFEGFLEATNSAITQNGYEVVFCAGDAEVIALSLGREKLKACVPYASYDRVKRSLDKLELYHAARRVGLVTPYTTEATRGALSKFRGGIVVKSRLHWCPSKNIVSSRFPVHTTFDHQLAMKHAAAICSDGGSALFQEYKEGKLLGFTALANKSGAVIARMQQVAPVTWPVTVGGPARAYTVPVDENLASKVSRLLSDLQWFGLVQLQFMLADDQKPYLIDFNGRTYMSLALAGTAGINFHDTWARLATNRRARVCKKATDGVHYQWFAGDIRRAFTQRRGGFFRDVASCFFYAVKATHPIWMRKDALPIRHIFDRVFRKKLLKYPSRVTWRLRRTRPIPVAPGENYNVSTKYIPNKIKSNT